MPFLHTSSTYKADVPLFKADNVPWIGIDVIITKLRSPLKGYGGIVKDVLCGQDTASGLKIIIQLASLDVVSPFKLKVVDYDDVIK